MSMLELRRVSKVYGQGTAGVHALADQSGTFSVGGSPDVPDTRRAGGKSPRMGGLGRSPYPRVPRPAPRMGDWADARGLVSVTSGAVR
jgi:hypothetical protein